MIATINPDALKITPRLNCFVLGLNIQKEEIAMNSSIMPKTTPIQLIEDLLLALCKSINSFIGQTTSLSLYITKPVTLL